LRTASVNRWTDAQRAEQAAIEALCVFANFSAKDEGRGRKLVARFERRADARLAAAAPAMLDVLRAFVSNYDTANPIRTADFHIDCDCLRCFRDKASDIIAKAVMP
jgi:hypothetical protein